MAKAHMEAAKRRSKSCTNTLAIGEARNFAKSLLRLRRPLAATPGVPQRRRATLPARRSCSMRVLKRLAPERVVVFPRSAAR